MPAEAAKPIPESSSREPVYVFGTDLAGQHKSESASLAVTLHSAEANKGSGRSGNAYAIPYRNSEGVLLGTDVIKNYVESLYRLATEQPDSQFCVARFACESAAHGDETMARQFANAPPNCQLPGLWMRALKPDLAARLLLFDPGAHLKQATWQDKLKRYLDLNVPLWGVPSIELVSVGHARALVANDMAAKKLGLKHRVIGPNEAHFGRNAQMAAEAKAVWYSTHLLSVFDFDMTAQPQQIRVMSAATRGGLQIDQFDTNLIN